MNRVFRKIRAFFLQGRVFDLAVGLVVGGIIGKIATLLIGDATVRLIWALGGGTLERLSVVLRPAVLDADGVTVLAEAVSLNYGRFLSTALDIVVMAAAFYFTVRAIKVLLRGREKPTLELAPADADPPAPTQEEISAKIQELLKEKD